jgi:hypothetical protein
LLPQALETYDVDKLAYDRNQEEWAQNKAWYDQYSAEGPFDSAEVQDRISNLPGYQAELEQGTKAIGGSASARGYLGSGRVLKELMNFGQNTLSKFYNSELDRLAQQAGMGANAASQTAQNAMGTGSAIGSLYQGLGDTKANAELARGNALSQALLAGNQQYKVVGQQDSGGGGLGGIGSVLGGIGSIMGAFPSSKKLKNKKGTPSTKAILKAIKGMDIDEWEYKQVPGRTFIGPYAEDVQKKLGVGTGKTLNVIDMLGVLFGSTKELAKQLDVLKKRNS